MKVKLFLCLSFCVSFLMTNITTAAVPLVDSPVGTYEIKITDIPDSPDIRGTMVVSKVNGQVMVNFSSSLGEIDLADAKLDGRKLSGKFKGFIMEGVLFKLNGKFTSNGFEGQLNTEFGAMGITGIKK